MLEKSEATRTLVYTNMLCYLLSTGNKGDGKDAEKKQKQKIKSIVAALATLEKEQVTDLVPKPLLEKARALAETASSS